MRIHESCFARARGGIAVLLLGALVPAALTVKAEAGEDPPAANHYLVYRVLAPVPGPYPVALRDPFSSPAFTSHVADPLEWFMNPAIKNGEPMVNPMLHYTWWRIQADASTRRIVIVSQFGEQELDVAAAEYLLNPALKVSTAGVDAVTKIPGSNGGGPAPPVANHYKCYRATGPFTPQAVTVQDQYGSYAGQVVTPEWVCTPADKEFDGVTEPVVEPDLNYVCYRVNLTPPATVRTVLFTDQFMTTDNAVAEATWLCVPSTKQIVVSAGPSTWGALKSMYR
jgi:hypothetical protein